MDTKTSDPGIAAPSTGFTNVGAMFHTNVRPETWFSFTFHSLFMTAGWTVVQGKFLEELKKLLFAMWST